jgi:hypothetical protein
MQPNGIVERHGMAQHNAVPRAEVPLLARFFDKIVLDILPAALASVIGGFLFTQYQFGHAAASRAATEQVTPASAEMMAMVRDEHAMMMDYLKSQMAAEKSQAAAEDAARAASASAETNTDADQADMRPAADAPTRRIAAALVASQAAPARAKRPVAAATARAPLVIAQADQGADGIEGVEPGDRLARDPDSLLAKTLDLKDHVVAATRHVVAAIGDAFASVGESIGVSATSTRPFNSAS